MSDDRSRVLVTGSAGFIGFHISRRLLDQGLEVEGVDHFSDYYDPGLKEARLQRILEDHPRFRCHRVDLADAAATRGVFQGGDFSHIVHLAAQPGVRYSLDNPQAYLQSNVAAFLNVLENCRRIGAEHLVYASSSSVYGAGRSLPFQESATTDHPVSFYGATKKSNEVMAHCYAHLFGLPVTGLRMFTVYGPWGRPDMAFFKFTRAILEGRPIEVYNEGKMERDFTFVDDVVEGIVRVMARPAKADPGWDASAPRSDCSQAPFRIYNIGKGRPVPLMSFISALEKALGEKAEIRFLPMQPGDVLSTSADVSRLSQDFGYRPRTGTAEGIRRFVGWYRRFYGV